MPRSVNYRVSLNGIDSDVLFFAGRPEIVYMRQPMLMARDDGSYRLGHPPAEGFFYDVYGWLGDTGTAEDFLGIRERRRYLSLPPLDPRIPELARNTVRGLRWRYGPRRSHCALPAPPLQLHAGTAFPRGRRPAGLFPVHPQEGALRVLRLGHGGDAAYAGHSFAPGDRFPERHFQSPDGAVCDPRFRCAQLGGGMAAGPRLGDVRSDAAGPFAGRQCAARQAVALCGRGGDVLAGVGGQLRSGPSGHAGRSHGTGQPARQPALARPPVRHGVEYGHWRRHGWSSTGVYGGCWRWLAEWRARGPRPSYGGRGACGWASGGCGAGRPA